MILTSKSTVVSDSKQALIRDFGSTLFGGYQNLKNDLSYLGFDPSNIHSGSYLSFAQDNTENLYIEGYTTNLKAFNSKGVFLL